MGIRLSTIFFTIINLVILIAIIIGIYTSIQVVKSYVNRK